MDRRIPQGQTAGNRNRFYIVTLVRYKHWTGPVYFNVIRLFSMILVNRMVRKEMEPPVKSNINFSGRASKPQTTKKAD